MTFRAGGVAISPVEERGDLEDTRLREEDPLTKNGTNSSPKALATRKVNTGSRTPGVITRRHGTRIGTIDPRRSQIDTETSPRRSIRKTEEEIQIRNMIIETQKRVIIPRSIMRRGESREELVIRKIIMLLAREKTREVDTEKDQETDRQKEDRGREAQARIQEDREIEDIAL